MGKKITIEEIKYRLSELSPNVEILQDYFENSKIKMPCRCKKCNHEWEANWANLSSGKKCPRCAGVIKYTFKEIKTKVELINDISVVDNYYSGIHTHVNCICNKCSHAWSPTWGSLKSGRGCPICAMKVKHGIGAYIPKNAKRFEREWKNKLGIVYIIKCFNDTEVFYKIGITKNSVKKRFENNVAMPYSYEVVDTINTNLYDAVNLEYELHNKFLDYKYIPLIKFDGFRECYSIKPNFE